MGLRSMELLIRLIRGESIEVTHITLATNLVVRQSTRAI
jgi:DNA-binding LacI/PurR family transcriptional regulator